MKITHVAVKFNSINTTYNLPKPFRHHHIFHFSNLSTTNPELFTSENCIEGFLDEEGNFLTRTEAYKLAVSTGQIRRDPDPKRYQGPELFSEDLW